MTLADTPAVRCRAPLPVPPLILPPLFLALGLVLTGCAALRPFAEVQRAVGAAEYVEVDGRQIHVEVRGQGEPLILLHGFGGSTYSWRKVVPALAARYRTVAIDLYGFGYTERPRELARYTRSGQLRLVRGVMDRLGLASAHFMGHSYGGSLTLTLAYQSPERVRSMILVDAAAPEYSVKRRKLIAGVRPFTWLYVRAVALRPAFVEQALRETYAEGTEISDEVVEAYLERIRIEGVVRAYLGLTAPLRGEPPPDVPFTEIRPPALVIWGEEDALITVEDGRKRSAELPHSRFAALPGSGHSPMEEQPDEVVRLVEEFLAEVTGGSETGTGGSTGVPSAASTSYLLPAMAR